MFRRNFLKMLGAILAAPAALLSIRIPESPRLHTLRRKIAKAVKREPKVLTWAGGIPGDWNNVSNWSPHTIPQDGDSLVLNTPCDSLPDEPVMFEHVTVGEHGSIGRLGSPLDPLDRFEAPWLRAPIQLLDGSEV